MHSRARPRDFDVLINTLNLCSLCALQDGLRRLWGHAFPGAPWQGLVAAKWTDMGWQRDDPSSDFRGAGLVALQNLLFMAQAREALWRTHSGG